MFLQAHVSQILFVKELFETALLHCGISSLEDATILRSNRCLNYSYNVLIYSQQLLLATSYSRYVLYGTCERTTPRDYVPGKYIPYIVPGSLPSRPPPSTNNYPNTRYCTCTCIPGSSIVVPSRTRYHIIITMGINITFGTLTYVRDCFARYFMTFLHQQQQKVRSATCNKLAL